MNENKEDLPRMGTKKPVISDGLLVVKAGLEPARRLKHKILNLACLPIPPLDPVAFIGFC